MKMKFYGVLMLVMGLALNLSAQINLGDKLQMDPQIRMGKLKNGMSYYIRHNQEPKQRAEFYIMQNVGALLENDDQDGLAHFLEHMCFNGTQNFPGNGIIKTLERHGVEFGRNINAYTAQDETVYNLSDIPVDKDPKLIDTCLMVLKDWSHYLELNEKEIDSERGVISEEWRTRNSASSRVRNQIWSVLFEGSIRANRDVIGKLDVIQNFKYQTLRDFYHDWYRTDLQAIVVVGDINVDEIEAKIKAIFSDIPAVENPKVRPFFEIPARKDIGYVCATDKELTTSSVTMYSIVRDQDSKDVASLKENFINSMYNSMLNSRISEKITKGDKNLLKGGAGMQGLVRGYRSFVVQAACRPNCGIAAFESVYEEVERAKRFGFNKSELERLKKNYITSLDNSYKQKDKIHNRTFVNEIKDVFMNDGISMNIEYYNPLAKALIESITVNDVNEYAKKIFTKENMVLIAQGPAEGVKHPTKEELLAAMEKVEKSELTPFKDEAAGNDLLSDELKGSKVVKVEKLPLLNAEKWTLENGTKVYYAKADFTKDNISLSSSSYGGTSTYDVDKLVAAGLTDQVMPAFGLGEFDAISLRKALAGKQVGVGVSISSYSEAISGASTKADFETMLQLVYMQFVKPRFDAQQFALIMDRSALQLEAAQGQPNKIINDSVALISNNYHPRVFITTPDMLRAVKIEDVEAIYRDRFQDAGSFNFFLVGDIEADEAKPLIEKYIGSLPNVERKESWVDHKIRPAKGTTTRDIDIKFTTPKAIVSVAFHKEMKAEPANILKANILRGILDLRYTTNIREKEGGTYGVSVRNGFSRIPVQKATMAMQFECDPAKAEHLKSLIYKEIEEIKANGVTEDEVQNIVKNLLKNREQGVKSNKYVISALTSYVQTGVNDTDPKNFEEILNKLTPKDIQKFAKSMFNKKTDIVDMMFRTK